MKKIDVKLGPMRRSHIRGCKAIVAVSEPWQTLNEQVDFRATLAPKRLNACSPVGMVCTVGREIAGFILYSPRPVFARGGYLRALAVAPRFRGRGIGKKLLQHAEKATKRHSRFFFLCVSSFNRSAQEFYKNRGYRKVGSIPGLIIKDASEHIYCKRLRTPSDSSRRSSRAGEKPEKNRSI